MGNRRGRKSGNRTEVVLWLFVIAGIAGSVLGLLLLLSNGSQNESERSLTVDLDEAATARGEEVKDQERNLVIEASPIVDELLDLIVDLEKVNIDYGDDLYEEEEAFRAYISSVVLPQNVHPVNAEYRPGWQEIAVSSNFEDLQHAASELASDLRGGSATLAGEEDDLIDSDELEAEEILELHREHAKAWERFADKFVVELGRWQESWEQNSPTAREFDVHLRTALFDEEVQISATFTSFCRALRSIDETVPLTAAQLTRVNAICDL